MWQEKYRPTDLDSIVLCEETRERLNRFVEEDNCPHLLLCGQVGIGKTSLARMIPHLLGREFMYINASDENGIDTIRTKVINYAENKATNGKSKIAILDEAGGLSSSGDEGGAQGALKNVMETFHENMRFILTANTKKKLITPLISRCLNLDIAPPLEGIVDRLKYVLEIESIEFDFNDLERFAKTFYPDMRTMLKILESSCRNGKFEYKPTNRKTKFATKLLGSLFKKTVDLKDIRDGYLSNGHEFDNNFYTLSLQLHEALFASDLENAIIRKAMREIHESLKFYELAGDKEVHFFSLCFAIREILS
jgi:DNA polymerase III delta prime subunit